MYVSAIVVAAGQGKRLKNKVSKPLLKLNSRPVISYSLDVLNRHPRIKEIIIVANPGNIKNLRSLVKQDRISKVTNVVLGGRERQDSVLNGLLASSSNNGFVLIHDAVRPFITADLISSLIKEARQSKAAIAAVPVKATVKRAKTQKSKGKTQIIVEKTVDRRGLWEIQTPQVFEKDLLLKAYRKFGKHNVTDDAGLVEKLGIKIRIVTSSALNIKITTPEDLAIAGAIARGLICHTR